MLAMTGKDNNSPIESIALCMIVKDEESSLACCLESVKGLVSEINVVDTGSSDNTLLIAKSYGARVRKIRWENDFSRARNVSLEMARAAWILVLDADEALAPEAVPTIKEAIRNPGATAYSLPTRNYTSDTSAAHFVSHPSAPEPAAGWVESRKVRLFKKSRNIRFEGEIHELVEPSLKRSGTQPQFLDAVVHHFGYLKEESFVRAKIRRMALLAEAKCGSNPRDYKAHYELGVIFNQLGQYDKAITSLRKAIELRPDFPQARYDLGVALLRKGLLDEASAEFRNVLQLEPANPDAMYNLAVSLQRLRQDEEAERLYRRLIERQPSAKAWNNLGALLAASGRILDAEAAFKNALLFDASFPDARQNLSRLGRAMPREDEHRAGTTPVRLDGISLCMIVKNEEEHLPLLLTRIARVVDEIIIVDTGSADNTRSIAENYGAHVYEFEWSNDFAAARNFALGKATREWILALDADELISDPDCAALRELTRNARVAAFSFETRNYTHDSSLEGWRPAHAADAMARSYPGWFPSEKVRLFRNMSDIRFEGAIHELVEPSLARIGGGIQRAPIPIHHYGYDKAAEKAKTYLGPARRKTSEQPENPEAHFELGAILHRLDRYTDACQSFRAATLRSPETARYHVALGESLRAAGQVREAKEAYEKALALAPDSHSAHRGLGIVLYGQNEFDAARREFERALELNPRDVQSLINLGAVLAKEGDIIHAKEHFERALEINPQNLVALNNLEKLSDVRTSVPAEGPTTPSILEQTHMKTVPKPIDQPDLTLNMIVKDEEQNLKEALTPIAHLFDEIVVVDTGSSDGTVETAERLGARVLRRSWTDDFSDARNTALIHSAGKWIFWLDADDRIAPEAVSILRKLIARGIPCGVFFPLESQIGRNGTRVKNYSLRMFPNRPGLAWTGRVHEQIAGSLKDCGLELVNCPDFTIRHVGYEGESAALKKNLRNLKLLAMEVAEKPEDPYLLFSLAEAFLFCGQAQHAVGWLQALWELREKKLNECGKDVFWAAAIVMSDCSAKANDSVNAELWLQRAVELLPHNWLAYFLLGERKVIEGDMEEASRLIEKVAELRISPTILPLDLTAIRQKFDIYRKKLQPAGCS
jgi:glycosyltransferase involved in cell wall biosynthesis